MEAGNWDLPETERDVAAVFGRGRAIAISRLVCIQLPSRRSNGQGRRGCLYVPKKLNERIVSLLGEEDGRKMVAAFPGQTLFFTCCRLALNRGRDEIIRRLKSKGCSWRVLSHASGLTERNLFNICRTPPKQRHSNITPGAEAISEIGDLLLSLHVFTWMERIKN